MTEACPAWWEGSWFPVELVSKRKNNFKEIEKKKKGEKSYTETRAEKHWPCSRQHTSARIPAVHVLTSTFAPETEEQNTLRNGELGESGNVNERLS